MEKYLLVTPSYPSDNNIYKNAFLHPRVKSFLASSLDVDVFSLDKNARESYEYDGVKVIVGAYQELESLIKEKNYKKIMVHFVLEKQVEFLRNVAPNTPLYVYAHGYDVTKWQRRRYIFEGKLLKQLAFIVWSNRRMKYVGHFLKTMKPGEKIVFVSNYLKNMVEEDFDCKLDKACYEIIANPVNTQIFSYKEKTADKRLKILSLRPYHNKNYGNDIAVQAVELLKDKAFFNELSFTFYGDGKLFDETLLPIKDLDNVKIHKGFINQSDMGTLYSEYGLFLSPARADTQGLVRLEAAYCGLVPLTSDVGAIGEFCKKDFSFLTTSAKELALCIEELFNNAQLFLAMSENAHRYVAKNLSENVVTKKEIDLLRS